MNSNAKEFCTCKDYKCVNHPLNHENGCTPCILKNLTRNEIPACFYRKIKDDLSEVQDFTFEGFVKFFQKNK